MQKGSKESSSNDLSLHAVLPTSVCYKCNMCDSWQSGLTEMKQHMSRRHQGAQIESLVGLQTAICARSGPRLSYVPTIAETQTLPVAEDNWRTQSLFAQRSMFGSTVPPIEKETMATYFPPKLGCPLVYGIRKQVKTFIEWISVQCEQSWSCELRNRMAPHGFKPIQTSSHSKYISLLTTFVYFCQKSSWEGKPQSIDVGDILWAVFSEQKSTIRMSYVAENFFFYSWHCMGRGKSSRDLAVISQDCACLKYGMRGGFLHYCLTTIGDQDVNELEAATRFFTCAGAFKQVSILKNIATGCMPVTDHQPVSWTPDSDFKSLTVLSVGVIVTHTSIQQAFEKVLIFVKEILDSYGVPELSIAQYKSIQDDANSTHAGQGFVGYNPDLFFGRKEWLDVRLQMDSETKRNFFNDCYACVNHLVVGLHLSAGPGFRGTEDASLLLVNSMSQSPRNLRAVGRGQHTQVCVIPVYSKQRPLSNGHPALIAKFIPMDLAFLLLRFIFFMKPLEGRVSKQIAHCATFLVTNCGFPVDAGSYNLVLNSVFRSVGLLMGISDLRHALEAFARFLPGLETTSVKPIRNRLFANHSSRSSAGYGRSDITVGQVDADILEEDEVASYIWNTVILHHSSRLDQQGSGDGPPQKKTAVCDGFQPSPGFLQRTSVAYEEFHPKDTASNSSPESSTETGTARTKVIVSATSTATESLACPSNDLFSMQPGDISGLSDRTSIDINNSKTMHPGPTAGILPHKHPAVQHVADLSQLPHEINVEMMPQAQMHPLPLSQLQSDCVLFIKNTKEDSVVVIPTGSGKTRLAQSIGHVIEVGDTDKVVTVVISPFQKISEQLMTTLGDNVFRWPLQGCSETHCIQNAQIIVVAIEHCEYNSAFVQFLRRLDQKQHIGRIFVDEVHHLLQADNPEFRKCLGNFWSFRSRLVDLSITAPIVGLTATLRQCDVQKLCSLFTGILRQMPIFRRSCYRESITMEIIWASNDLEVEQKCSQTSLNDAQTTGKTIVFATSLDAVNALARAMKCQAVTSGIPLDVAEFETNRLFAASSCAGHGLDLKAIKVVAISGVPFDVETLLQWAGRIRESGHVKIYLNEKLVTALSRSDDRRGELARVFLEHKGKRNDLQKECCQLIDGCEEVALTQQTQAVQSSLVFDLQDVVKIKINLLACIASVPSGCCKVCFILGDRSGSECGYVCRKFAGICVRCFQKHSLKDCKNGRFQMPGKSLCYKCFLPFGKGIGPDMHPGDIGGQCSTSMCDVLPRVAFILFYSRSALIPSKLHGDLRMFSIWLSTMDSDTRLFGILKLLKAIMS